MIDPTFARHYSLAAQEDILRQAGRKHERWQAGPASKRRGAAWLALLAVRLITLLRTHVHRSDPRSLRTEPLEDSAQVPS
ncbi:MAG TPA: hypothetical protein VNL71_18955 [Chloroflexota bacterium]|nr:hypothetical protein [Chloroflexota bacterium]